MPIVEAGLARAGRRLDDFDVAAYLLVSVDENEADAVNAAKRFVVQKLPTRHSDMLRHAVQRHGLVKAAAPVDDDVVRKVAIAGTPDQVAQSLRAFLGTGLKLPIAWEIVGPDRRRSLDLLARAVMPKLA